MHTANRLVGWKTARHELRDGTCARRCGWPWLLAALCLILMSCSQEGPKKPPAPRVARVVRIHLEGGGVHGEASGVIESRHNVQVGFLVGGRLIERDVDVGMWWTRALSSLSSTQPTTRIGSPRPNPSSTPPRPR